MEHKPTKGPKKIRPTKMWTDVDSNKRPIEPSKRKMCIDDVSIMVLDYRDYRILKRAAKRKVKR